MQIDPVSGGQLVSYLFMLAISTLVGWIVKVLPGIRDDVRAVKREVMGRNGGGGLIDKVDGLLKKVDAIDDRHIRSDVVTEIEKELSEGKARRLRDKVLGTAEHRDVE